MRFDDYHQDVSLATWQDVLSAYDDRGLRGVIGVIPAHHSTPIDDDAVEFIKELEQNGWELAQHGYTHENIGDGSGGLLGDHRSEFAGVELAEQRRRIRAGKSILTDHGIEPETFIPPWHEYDRNTIRALADAGFSCLNEGRWILPRTIDDIVLIPTHPPLVTPEHFPIGVVSLVSHPQFEN
ncbi:MAG: DUF2334 domain-containing protein, partial [Halobacteriaceae archaeon]